MSMRMMMEVFTPCVQNCRDADVGSEVLGIGSNDGEGLGRSFQQQAIDDGLVLIGDSAKRRRQPEHQVKIRNGQEFGFARRKPCRCRMRLAPWTMPIAAGIIEDPGMLTFLAALDMSPELGSSANLDRLHHAPLNPIDVTGVGNAPCFTVTTEDIRYFQFPPEHVSHPLSSPPPRRTPLAPARWQTSEREAAATRRPNPRPPNRPAGDPRRRRASGSPRADRAI